MDEDDGFTTSDAEFDSEIEDVDGELGMWLNQLNSYTNQQDEPSQIPNKLSSGRNHMTVTPKQVMETFRCSILDPGDNQDLDFDTILGELCQLETQLNTQQSEIKTSMKNIGMSTSVTGTTAEEAGLRAAKPVAADEPKTDLAAVKNRDSLAELESALDNQLQSALSELSDLVGISFDTAPNGDDHRFPRSTTSDGVSSVQSSSAASHAPTTDGLGARMPQPKRDSERRVPAGVHASQNGATGQEFHDYSPDGAEVDSAFSDSSSLPSSGSHVSVTTTSSQNSNSSGSSYNSGSSGIGNCTHLAVESIYGMFERDDIREHLARFGASLAKSDLSPTEQAALLKAEKVKIALQKIKEANIQKLFVRFYSEDGCSKSILVDESMRVSHVLDRLVAKNNVMPSVSWAVVEHLPDLFMERLVEDHELMVEPLMCWSHNSRNKLLFVQSPGKYHIFLRPEFYLMKDKKGELSESARESIIQEHFSDENSRFPEVEGYLYLKTEGKKAWKKYFFVLRASGLYYTPKGKGKLAKDLLCLQKLDVVEVYTAVSWKKKYKAPTDYGFALKHPQIQNKTPKYIKYLCAEDQDTFSQWVTGIRVAKHGNQLLKNYQLAKKNLETWHSREILPNQNFAEYLAKENERNQEFAKEHHLLPRKSVCASATLADSVSENGDLDKQSLSSGTSHSSRSSTCSHDQDASSGSHGSIQSCSEPVRKLSDGFLGNGSCRRGSLPTIGEGQRRSSMDHNQNREQESGNDDVRLVGKMIPNLPVTTQTTRQITDQNAHSGTLKRQASYGTMKSLKRNLNGTENRLPSPQKPMPPVSPEKRDERVDGDDDDDDDDADFPLPPPPPELLSPPIVEETAYSIVNVNQPRPVVVYDVPKPRGGGGGSLPNSPQKRPPVYAKPTVVRALSPQGRSPPPSVSSPQASLSSCSAPQSPASHHLSAHSQPTSPRQLTVVTTSTRTVQTPSCVVASHPSVASPLHAGHRRASSSPGHGDGSRRPPPPPPKRSETTKLSSQRDSPQTQYFISDLQRVLTQKQAWSQEMGPEPSFPPTPPPHKPRPQDTPQSEPNDEWLPPPPAELLLELQEVRKKKPVPPKPLPKKVTDRYVTLKKTQSYESQA